MASETGIFVAIKSIAITAYNLIKLLHAGIEYFNIHNKMEKNTNPEKKKEENITRLRDLIPIYIPGVERGLINKRNRKGRFLDFLKAKPAKNWFLKFRKKRNLIQIDDSSSDQNLATENTSHRFRVPFVRKINWQFLIQYAKNWIKHPMNMAFLLWFFFVAVGIVILGLLMLGLLNDAIKDKDLRTRWTEIVNQIVNALFTIMCIYQHPKIAHHLVLLCRWLPKDAVELRMAYCKTPSMRRYERAHIGFVIVLLHLTCISQYVLCALYWGWTSDNRPDWATYTFMGVGIVAPVTAFLWTVYSPLGKKITLESDLETEDGIITDIEGSQNKRSRISVVVTEPEWLGGLFDCWDDITVAYLSFFCTFCVFGWNMERLGFGNMYVHIATFVLLCIAPVLVFSISALKVSDDSLKYVMGISGCVLCFCCFLYGGFWRIQLRKKFKLPANPFCCGYPSVTDCFQWLFCWSCSLAQEVRTGNFYEVEEDSFYMRRLREEARNVLEPLDREGVIRDVDSTSSSSSVEFVSIPIEKDQIMRAPSPPMIDLDGKFS